MRTTLVVIAALLLSAALFFTVRAGIRIVVSARRAFASYRPLPAAEIPNRLARLLRKGRDGEFLVIQDVASERFVQIRKYADGPGHSGLSFDFPRAPWSAMYYDQVQSRMERDGIRFALQPTLDAPVTEFLQVDCGRDLELATTVVDRVLFDVFGIPRDGRFRVSDGAAIRGPVCRSTEL